MTGFIPPSETCATSRSRLRVLVALTVATFVACATLVVAERSDADVAAAAGAVWYVAPGGSDGNSGAAGSPLATLQQAIDRANSGDEIRLAAGTYQQEATVNNKTVHIVGAGIDKTVLDGARRITNWGRTGSTWSTPWTPIMPRAEDIQTTPDRREAGFPEQVFVDGRPLTEVGSIGALVPGTFFTDVRANRIHLVDDPAGRRVDVSVLTSGLYLNRAANSTVTGLTVQRFATPQSKMAALRAYSDNATITDVAVRNNSYGGISAIGSNITFNRVTATYNGHNGMHGHNANRLRVIGARLVGNNTERFDASWAAGAIKVTTSNGFTFTDGVVEGNAGPAVWTDLDVTDTVVARNVIRGNMRSGVMLELSQRAIVADNLIVGNGQAGLYVLESTNVDLWHNSVFDNHWDLRILTGPRDNVDTVAVRNNALGGSVPSGQAIMHADDWTSKRSAAQMNITWSNNRIWWPTSSQGRWVSRIQNWPADQSLSTTIEAHRVATGRQAASSILSRASSNPFAPSYRAGDGRPAAGAAVGDSMPSNIAAVMNVASGSRFAPGARSAVADAAAYPNWSAPLPSVGPATPAAVGSLNAPRDVAVAQSPTGLQVSWTAPSSGQTPSSYAVWVNGEQVATTPFRATEVPPAQSGVSSVQVQSIGADGSRSAKTAPVTFGEPAGQDATPPPASLAPADRKPPPSPSTTTPRTTPSSTSPTTPTTTTPPRSTPVYVPRNVAATSIDADTIRVSWSSPSGGQTPYFYILYVNGEQVATTNTLAADVPPVSSGVSFVQVRAVGVGTVSVKSAPVAVQPFDDGQDVTLATPSSVRVDGQSISWSANGSANASYQIWMNGNLVSVTKQTSARLPEANSDGVYIQVASLAPNGEASARSAPLKVSMKSTAGTTSLVRYATSLQASYEANGRISADWDAPTSGTPAASYNVWSNGVLVASGVTSTNVVLPPAEGDQYVQVQAVSAAGERGGKTAPVRVRG